MERSRPARCAVRCAQRGGYIVHSLHAVQRRVETTPRSSHGANAGKCGGHGAPKDADQDDQEPRRADQSHCVHHLTTWELREAIVAVASKKMKPTTCKSSEKPNHLTADITELSLTRTICERERTIAFPGHFRNSHLRQILPGSKRFRNFFSATEYCSST